MTIQDEGRISLWRQQYQSELHIYLLRRLSVMMIIIIINALVIRMACDDADISVCLSLLYDIRYECTYFLFTCIVY